MQATLWGVRGSVPVPGPATEQFGGSRRLHVLLTHRHLDHIQGLMFFAPFFDPDVEITVWGPPAAGRALRKRLARYISDPLSPIEIGELRARVAFRDVPPEPWCVGAVELRAALESHRGVTFGRRSGVQRLLLFHHDPWHDDAFLGSLEREASELWTRLGGAGRAALGREGDVIDLGKDPERADANSRKAARVERMA